MVAMGIRSRQALQRQSKADERTAPGAAVNVAFAAQSIESAAHASDAVFSWRLAIEPEAASIVGYRDAQTFFGHLDFQPNLSGSRVTHDVVEGFFEGEKDAVARFGV